MITMTIVTPLCCRMRTSILGESVYTLPASWSEILPELGKLLPETETKRHVGLGVTVLRIRAHTASVNAIASEKVYVCGLALHDVTVIGT